MKLTVNVSRNTCLLFTLILILPISKVFYRHYYLLNDRCTRQGSWPRTQRPPTWATLTKWATSLASCGARVRSPTSRWNRRWRTGCWRGATCCGRSWLDALKKVTNCDFQRFRLLCPEPKWLLENWSSVLFWNSIFENYSKWKSNYLVVFNHLNKFEKKLTSW